MLSSNLLLFFQGIHVSCQKRLLKCIFIIYLFIIYVSSKCLCESQNNIQLPSKIQSPLIFSVRRREAFLSDGPSVCVRVAVTGVWE